MSERSLICLTAFALVTGVILLVASSALVEFLGIEEPREVVAVGFEESQAPVVQTPALEIAPEFNDGLMADESMVDDESPITQELAFEDRDTSAEGIEAWTEDETAEIATEQTPVEPVVAVDDQDSEQVGQETADLPGDAYLPESEYGAGYDAEAVGGLPNAADYPAAYGDQVSGASTYTIPQYEPPVVEPYASDYGEYPSGVASQQLSELPDEVAPTVIQDPVSQVEPTTKMQPSAVDVVQTAAIADFPPTMPPAPTSPLVPQPVSGGNGLPADAPSDQNPLRLGPALNRVAQVPRATGPAEAEIFEPERLDDPAAGNTDSESNADDEVPSLENEETKLGEEPEETTTELQFLRRQSVLLDPGQYQFDVTLQYLVNDDDFPLAQQVENLIQIGEAGRKQRLLLLPIEFRIGLTPVSQLFVNVPFGWSNGEIAFQGVDEFENSGGIGDVSAGITRILIEGNDWFPDVLSTIAFSAPTGDSNFVTSLSTPGNTLGEGFWTLTAGLSFIQTFDPVVVFYGFGYRHRFENNFDVNVGDGKITVNPGKQIFYRFGAGFAVNPQVTLSASFIGSYLTEDYVDGVRLAGSIREPMSVRLAATISKDKELKKGQRIRTIEPFISFGVTDDAANALFGVSCTH